MKMRSKTLDMIITVLWLGMDTLWAFGMPGPTVNIGMLLTAAQLISAMNAIGTTNQRFVQEAALLSWAMMNVIWVSEDWLHVSLSTAKAVAVVLAWTLTIAAFWKYGITIKRIRDGRD